jgi:hypothetical protein
MADDIKQQANNPPMPGKQDGRPMTHGLQPAQARENPPLRDPTKRNVKGRPPGSVNRYTGALKELFLQAADNVGNRTTVGPNGELDGKGGALAFLKVCSIKERKTFFTVMARLLPITINSAPPLKEVLTREEALHELRERGLDLRLIDHLRRLPFPEELEQSSLDEISPEIVEHEGETEDK